MWKQGWVFPLFSPDSDDRLSLNFHRFVNDIEVVVHEVWALDNTVYRKGREILVVDETGYFTATGPSCSKLITRASTV